MPDLKAGELAGGGFALDLDLADISRHFSLHLVHEAHKSIVTAFGYQLDPSVRLVADKTAHRMPSSHLRGGVTETDALNVP